MSAGAGRIDVEDGNMEEENMEDDMRKTTGLVTMTRAAIRNIEESGCDVASDIEGLRVGPWTEATLLEHCLSGCDVDREEGWCDYVAAVVDAMRRGVTDPEIVEVQS